MDEQSLLTRTSQRVWNVLNLLTIHINIANMHLSNNWLRIIYKWWILSCLSCRRVRQAQQFSWYATGGVTEKMVLENLPEDLLIDIRRHLFNFIKKVRIGTFKRSSWLLLKFYLWFSFPYKSTWNLLASNRSWMRTILKTKLYAYSSWN
jgi:hypothetical protein